MPGQPISSGVVIPMGPIRQVHADVLDIGSFETGPSDGQVVLLSHGSIGRSSVRYEIGLFANDEETAAAQGYFVHVYVNRADNQPVPIPDDVRRVLERLLRPAAEAGNAPAHQPDVQC